MSPHALRHTCATQLLNAGCRVTSIQKLLGHRHIGTTLIYARVHDRTVAEDYYAAMVNIEKGLELDVKTGNGDRRIAIGDPARLLDLVDQLAAPQLGVAARLDLVEQMRSLLNGNSLAGVRIGAVDPMAIGRSSPAGDWREGGHQLMSHSCVAMAMPALSVTSSLGYRGSSSSASKSPSQVVIPSGPDDSTM